MLLDTTEAFTARGRPTLAHWVVMTLDPLVIVLCLLASIMICGAAIGGAEVVLALVVFSMNYPSPAIQRPGVVSLASRLPSAATDLTCLQDQGTSASLAAPSWQREHAGVDLFGPRSGHVPPPGSPWRTLVKRTTWQRIAPSVLHWLGTAAVLVFLGYATRMIGNFDSHMLWIWALLTTAMLALIHGLLPWLVQPLLEIEPVRTAAIAGISESGIRLARRLGGDGDYPWRFIGFFDDAEAAKPAPAHDMPVLGSLDEVAAYCERHRIDSLFIALPLAAQARMLGLLDQLKNTTVSIYFVPDVFVTDLINARVDTIHGVPVMTLCETPITGGSALAKRALDLVGAGLALVLLAPLMLTIAAGVKISSAGPVIFRQRRYGLDGRQIVVWKFRTMTVIEDGSRVVQATRDDRRVTRLGRMLRATSLDELPQLFNVLGGSMSLVGPRPHAVAHNEEYRALIKGYMVRHKVKPGISGWAQVNGLRGETRTLDTMRARVAYDLEYLRHWSLGLDLRILLRTVAIVWHRTNAY